MAWDYDSAGQKRRELERQIIATLLANQAGSYPQIQELAPKIVQHYVSISPPEKEEAPMELIVVSGVGRGGRTSKPGNLRLNIRELVNSLATGVLTAVGAAAIKWTVPLAALVIWNDLYAKATVLLSEVDASVIWTMWLTADHAATVADVDLLDLVNAERRKAGGSEITRVELDHALTTLTKLRCIQRSKQDVSRWLLREWVSVDYR